MAMNRSRLIRRILYVLVALVIIAFLVTRIFTKKDESTYVTEKVANMDVAQSVEVSGTTEVQNRFQLQFLQSGRLANTPVKEGDRVKAGDILGTLENGDVALQLESQKSALRIVQANLAKALASPRTEEINLNKFKVDLAKVDLTTATKSQKNLLALARKNIDLSSVALSQAKNSYNQAQYTLNYAQLSGDLDNSASYINSDNAAIGVDQSRQDLQYTTMNGQQGINQNQASLIPRFQSLLNNFQNSLQSINSVLKTANNQNMYDSQNLYSQINSMVESYRNQIESLGVQPSSSQIENAFSNSQNLYSQFNNLFSVTKDLLNNSNGSGTFPPEQLAALQQANDGNFQALQQNYQTFLQSYQALQTLQDKAAYSESSSNSAYQLKNNTQNSAYLQSRQTDLASQKKVEDARSSVNQAQLNLAQAEENYNKSVLDYNRQADDISGNIQKANIGVKSAQEQLNLLKAPQREIDVAPIKAQIDQAWDSVHLAEYRLEQTQIKAPADGIITEIHSKEGENISMAQSFITLDSDGFLVKVLVSEADIIKIKQNDTVMITFDALGTDKEFEGTVQKVSPAESIIQGVIYYEVKVAFDPKGENIKPGMTANVSIKTALKEKTIAVPLRAIQYEANVPFVEVLKKDEKNNEQVEKRTVTLGLQGDQYVEIMSGVTEGEEVITFTKATT